MSPQRRRKAGALGSQQSSQFIYKLCFKPQRSCLHPGAKRCERSLLLCLPILASLNPQYYSHIHYIYPLSPLKGIFHVLQVHRGSLRRRDIGLQAHPVKERKGNAASELARGFEGDS